MSLSELKSWKSQRLENGKNRAIPFLSLYIFWNTEPQHPTQRTIGTQSRSIKPEELLHAPCRKPLPYTKVLPFLDIPVPVHPKQDIIPGSPWVKYMHVHHKQARVIWESCFFKKSPWGSPLLKWAVTLRLPKKAFLFFHFSGAWHSLVPKQTGSCSFRAPLSPSCLACR